MARQPVEGTLRAMFLEELQFDGADCQGDHVGRRDPRGRPGFVPGRGDRRRRVRPSRRHPLGPGRAPLHHRREERGTGRHLVGEPLSGRARRCRQSPLLLLLRAGRPLDRVLLPAAGAAWVFRGRAGQVPTGAPLSLQHRGDRREVGRRAEPLGGPGSDARGHRRDAGRPLRDQRRRFPQPAENAGDPGDGLVRGSLVPFGTVARRPRHHRLPLRTRRGRRHRVPDRPDHRRTGWTPQHLPTHAAVDHPQPHLPRQGARRRCLGHAPPSVLRAMVPLHHDVPGRGAGHRALPHGTRTTTTVRDGRSTSPMRRGGSR